MKIGVISDTHGDVQAWRNALKLFEGASFILHSGDVLYHGVFNPIIKTYDGKKLADELNNSPIPLIFARGNCDSDVDQLALKYPISSHVTETVLDGLNVLIHHGDKFSNKQLADKYKPNIIISGHTHVYGVSQYSDTIIVNPGSASLPKDPEKTPTVAVIEDRKIQIRNLDTSGVILETAISSPLTGED